MTRERVFKRQEQVFPLFAQGRLLVRYAMSPFPSSPTDNKFGISFATSESPTEYRV